MCGLPKCHCPSWFLHKMHFTTLAIYTWRHRCGLWGENRPPLTSLASGWIRVHLDVFVDSDHKLLCHILLASVTNLCGRIPQNWKRIGILQPTSPSFLQKSCWGSSTIWALKICAAVVRCAALGQNWPRPALCGSTSTRCVGPEVRCLIFILRN